MNDYSTNNWISHLAFATFRLALVIGIWVLFFQLYSLTGLGEPSFKPLILFMIGFYVILEILVAVLSLYLNNNAPEEDSLTTSLRKLAETIEEAKSRS